MKLAGHDAERIHGTLDVELADGGLATLHIDVDVSDPRSFIELQNHYEDGEYNLLLKQRPSRLVSQTISIHWPTLSESANPPLTIVVPLNGRA